MTVSSRPRLSTIARPSTHNTFIASCGSETLGDIYKTHSNNFYFMHSRNCPSVMFGSLNDAVSALYKSKESAKAKHEKQQAETLEHITATWGHTDVPGTKRVSNTPIRKPVYMAAPKPSRTATPSHIKTVIINGSECVKTRNGLIPIE